MVNPRIITYFLKSPGPSRRASFSIIRREIRDSNKPTYSVFKSKQTEHLNKLYKEQTLSFEAARSEFKAIIKLLTENELKRRGDLVRVAENNTILTDYLTVKYPARRRREIDFKAAENESARTLKILGNNSILSMSSEQIQKCIDRVEPRLQKRYVYRLNSILRTLGRTDVQLFYTRTKRPRVSHIDRSDLNLLVKSIDIESLRVGGLTGRDFKSLIITLFCTGMRIGEALAVEPTDFNKAKYFIRINRQLKQNGQIADTKNRKERKAVVLPFGVDEVEHWVNLDKSKLSRYQIGKYLSKKTKELFKDKNKHISLHGLRHSYAIYLLRVVETSISNVAAFLGDNIKTTEDYYIDFVVSDEVIESIIQKLIL